MGFSTESARAAVSVLLPAAAAAASPLKPTLLDAEAYTETTTAIADLDDGTYVQAQLALSNIGIGDGKAACRVLVVPPAGDPWTAARTFDRDQWHFGARPVARLVVGTCQMVASRSLVVDLQVEGASVHLEIDGPLRPVAPPGNHVGDPGGAFYTYELVVPWGVARARLALPGRTPSASAGRGYADHSRSTMMPADLARAWVRFRGLGADCPTLLLVRSPPEGGSQGWIWRAPAAAPTRFAPTVRLPAAAGAPVVLTGADTVRIQPSTTLYRHAPLEEYALAGLVRGWIGSPETTTSRATLDAPGCPPVAGILEVTTVQR